MTRVVFLEEAGQLVGFSLQGHSTVNGDDEIGRRVCVAVSSAAYLTANTVTDVCGLQADVWDKDGEMFLRLNGAPSNGASQVLQGFRLHITALAAQYPAHIQITTEV